MDFLAAACAATVDCYRCDECRITWIQDKEDSDPITLTLTGPAGAGEFLAALINA